MTTTSSIINKQVGAKLQSIIDVNQTTETKTTTNASNTNTAPKQTVEQAPKSKNLNIFSAAVSMYRQQNAPESKPFTPTEEQRKTFEEAQKNIAQERGLNPEDLKPLDVMKQAAFDYHKELDISNNEQAKTDLQDEIKALYEKHESQPEQTPQNLSSAISNIVFYTDEDFKSLNEEDQQKYLESISEYGGEKDRLEKLLESLKESENDDEKSSFGLKNTDEDPGILKTSDEDYKSKKGDIIDWMMDEVIMASIDWLGNRCVDFAAPIVYASADAIWDVTGRNLWKNKKKLWDKTGGKLYRSAKDIAKDFINNIKNKQNNNDDNDNNSNTPSTPTNGNNPSSTPDNKQEPNTQETTPLLTPDEALKKIDENISEYEKLNAFSQSAEQIKLTDITAKVYAGSISLEKDGFIENGKKSEYKSLGLVDDDKCSAFFTSVREKMIPELISRVYSDIYGKEDEYDETKFKSISLWVGKTIDANEDAAKNGKQPEKIKVPDDLEKEGITTDQLEKSLTKARNERIASIRAQILIKQMEYNSEIFALNYTRYKITEMMRKGDTIENLPELIKTFNAEGKNIMFQNYADLRSGNTNAVSDEEMIQLSKNMSEQSKNLLETKDKTTTITDKISERFKPQTDNKPKTLEDFTFNDVISVERSNLSKLDKE